MKAAQLLFNFLRQRKNVCLCRAQNGCKSEKVSFDSFSVFKDSYLKALNRSVEIFIKWSTMEQPESSWKWKSV